VNPGSVRSSFTAEDMWLCNCMKLTFTIGCLNFLMVRMLNLGNWCPNNYKR